MAKPIRIKQKSKYCETNYQNSYRRWVALALVTGGMFQLAAPAIAEGTAAGTTISNTATGTYTDDTGIEIQTTSNTVQITVAEVAGITVQTAGISNVTTSGSTTLLPGETGDFKFIVTNAGNDATKFFIPSASVLNGASAVINGQATKVSYVLLNADGTVNTSVNPVDVTGNGIETSSLPVGGKIQVIVRVNVPTNIPNSSDVSVRLGNTAPGGNQNVARNANADDVYTVDNPDGAPGEVAGAPLNGVREASAEHTITLGAETKQPFVKIKKTHDNYEENGTSGPIGDTLDYNLQLNVLNDANIPSGAPLGINGTAALQPTYVEGLAEKHVLVSDVIPAGTELNAAPAPTAPSGWTVVYSTDDPVLTNNPSYKAAWTPTAPTTPAGFAAVKRIGFIFGTPGTAGGAVTNNNADINFTFTVKLTGAIQQGAEIANIAQVFGEKDTTASGNASSATVPGIFDESGDDQANNDSNGDGAPDYLAYQTTGIGNPASQGRDSGNDNTGVGPGGEANVFTVPLLSTGILNGTVVNGVLRPDAVGPTDNNDDFTNRASQVTPTTVPIVTFQNSLRNTSGGVADLSLTVLASNLRGLPVGTSVITIEYTGLPKVTYTVTQASVGGTPTIVADRPPVKILNVANGVERQYAVTVDLPDTAPQNQSYDVPVTAFIDSPNGNNLPDGSEAQNITINRVYAGFIRLVKQTRVLDENSQPVAGDRGIFSIAPKAAAPGEVIEYLITYRNISEPQPKDQQYNVILNGKNLVITDDGANGGNNWALDQDGNGVIDTSHVRWTGFDDTNTKLEFFNGAVSLGATEPVNNTVVTKYTNTTNSNFILGPGDEGTFSFKRKVN